MHFCWSFIISRDSPQGQLHVPRYHHCKITDITAIAGTGLYLVGNTGIALGRPADGHASAVWQEVDAVLDCSLEPVNRCPHLPCHCITLNSIHWGIKLQTVQFSNWLTSLCCCSPVDKQGSAAAFGVKQSGRFLHLPVKDAKHDRHGLQANLPSALAFASHHLEQHRRVLVLCSGGELPCHDS